MGSSVKNNFVKNRSVASDSELWENFPLYFLIEVLLAKRKPLISPVLHDSEEVVSHKSYHNIDAITSAQLLQHSPGKTSNESK